MADDMSMAATIAERPPHVPPERVVDFDIYNVQGVVEDFHKAWAVLCQDNMPDLVWTPRTGGHWIATRGKLIKEIFSDYERFSSRVVILPKVSGEHWVMRPITLDPPEHRPFRNLLNNDLSPRRVNELSDRVRSLAVELIEGFRPNGRCDFIKDYAEKLPIYIIMKVFDLPLEDAPILRHYVNQITRPDGAMTYSDAVAAFDAHIRPVIRSRMTGGGSDLLSNVARGSIGDRPITEEEAVQMAIQTVAAGLDTVVNALSTIMYGLVQQPALREELIANPELIDGAADELLRRYASLTMAREVARDVDYAGVQLKKGEMIALPTFLSGLDERENPHAMTVDFRRPQIFETTFGAGIHICPGKFLARMEVRITLEEWLSRIPHFKIADGAEIKQTSGLIGSFQGDIPLVWN